MSLTWPQWPGVTLWPLKAGPAVEVRGKHPLSDLPPHELEARWTAMSRANPHLFDGPILALNTFDPQTGRVVCRRSSYKWLALQPRIKTAHPVTLVAVNGVVTAVDVAGREHLLFARRAAGTWMYGGQWELSPAGGVPPPPTDGPVPTGLLVDQLRCELQEEAGISIPALPASPVGFYADARAHSFNVIFRVRLAQPLDDLRSVTGPADWDTAAARWVPRAEIKSFAESHPCIHSTLAILEWFEGQEKHGQ